MTREATPKSSPESKQSLKPYHTPTLKAYGNVHEITAGHTHMGSHDSKFGMSPNKTLA